MRIYIDCEFNGHGGELISMALVCEDGPEWYEVVMGNKPCLPWVIANVIPVLGKPRISKAQFHADLADFLVAFCAGCEFIADHPADFIHLCRMMDNISAENDFRIPIECTMTLLRGSPDIAPEIPHNALSDARALMRWHQAHLLKADTSAHTKGSHPKTCECYTCWQAMEIRCQINEGEKPKAHPFDHPPHRY